jgi:hypothetical protein
MSQILFAPEVAFRSLNGSVAQQELNLLDLAAVRVAQFRAGPSQVVGRNVFGDLKPIFVFPIRQDLGGNQCGKPDR